MTFNIHATLEMESSCGYLSWPDFNRLLESNYLADIVMNVIADLKHSSDALL